MRRDERAFVVEGPKLLHEAIRGGASVLDVFVAPGGDDHVVADAVAAGARCHELAPGVLERVGDTVTPQPVAAIVAAVDVDLDAMRSKQFVVVCVDVRDPGNLGTVLRVAEASGAGGVICCEGSVDAFSPKTVRASAGSLFHVPVVAGGEPLEVLDRMGRWGVHRMGTDAHGGSPYDTVDLTVPTALVLGNEAHGLPDHVRTRLDGIVTIPMVGRTESLNVSMAAAVLCFERARQQRAQ
ncbi:MAG: RNA methyltransferase [Acidimicrobiia bacterium]|nr:RNA methyltransferase [Acidimicrobiia bacterium]